ncbi:DUF5130 family protein [Nocardioides jiangxiensis]|uniref:DUF5130 family protein n=1 Tax=Nocardioides jiangxiensis TaxID=3064524 RepID=A0ABT9B2H1_9ACTN|nr:DUF5130 family protein [Nocardioides sp. WY-20]MDO7869045.1 DUF5130 family protein [Nocardioides sp. WY-20]
MPAGDAFTREQRLSIAEAIRKAELRSRMEITAYVGPAEGDPRSFATQLHNTLAAPSRSLVIMVDPAQRALEIVTGGWVRERLSDEQVQLTALEMQLAFSEGDLAGGLVRGIGSLADRATA